MAGTTPFMDINLHASDSQYAFTSPSNPTAPTLVVDRPSGDLRLSDGRPTGAKRVSSIAGVLGMIKLRLDKYIVIITKSRPVGKIKGAMIYKVVATELLPLRERQLHDNDEDAYMSLLRSILKSAPMYFSYTLDLTNSFQRQSQSDPSMPLWRRADDRFFWNKFISADLMDFRSGGAGSSAMRLNLGEQPGVDPFILPVISGMFSLSKSSVKGTSFNFALITRRSRHRTGTRYFSRGIDENGNVSNFNETEQIVVLNEVESGPGGLGAANGYAKGSAGRDVQILAYLQTRGSVPVYWAEVNQLHYTPDLQVRGVDSALNAAQRHFDEQIKIYGDNYLVNLVNQKGREKRIKEAYEQMVRQLQTHPRSEKESSGNSLEAIRKVDSLTEQTKFDRLHYVYFDFHNETKGLQWHRAQLLLDTLNDGLAKQQYFHGVYSLTDRTGRVEVRNTQRSVVRTNCMDCLDRTNVVQSMLGRYAFTRIFQDLQVIGRNESPSDNAEFEHIFRNAWADNADVVSKSYSGTGALKTDYTRTGVRTKAGALQDLNHSISRYVRNNFSDGPRQDAFDLFSGAYLPSSLSSATNYLFVDRRPALIQSVPYVLLASLFFVSIATATRQIPDGTVWPLRLLMLIFTVVAVYCANFMWTHGGLYVNWPKLNTPPWAAESYQEAMKSLHRDPVLGNFIKHRDERSRVDGRLGHLEEGKKRVE